MPSPSLPPLAWLRTVPSCSPCFAPQVGARRRALQRYSTAAAAHELPRGAENGSGQARGHPLVESKRLRGYRQVLKPVVQAKLQFQEASFPAPRDARPELPVLWSAELAQRTPCALDPPAAGSEDLSPVACPGSVMFLALPVTQPALRSRIFFVGFPRALKKQGTLPTSKPAASSICTKTKTMRIWAYGSTTRQQPEIRPRGSVTRHPCGREKPPHCPVPEPEPGTTAAWLEVGVAQKPTSVLHAVEAWTRTHALFLILC